MGMGIQPGMPQNGVYPPTQLSAQDQSTISGLAMAAGDSADSVSNGSPSTQLSNISQYIEQNPSAAQSVAQNILNDPSDFSQLAQDDPNDAQSFLSTVMQADPNDAQALQQFASSIPPPNGGTGGISYQG